MVSVLPEESSSVAHSRPIDPCFTYSSNNLSLCFPSSQLNQNQQIGRERGQFTTSTLT